MVSRKFKSKKDNLKLINPDQKDQYHLKNSIPYLKFKFKIQIQNTKQI